ncbi:MAG TPA: MerR family transcriptional regulator [Vicinamibacterales bacterium]|nr:MerR family transcriptional regulator [Vicinamibacterales bacterium]
MSIHTSDRTPQPAVEPPSSRDDVMLIDEVAATLKITVKQIRRLERRGAFPIPRLPKLDRHPRYSRVLVERFAAGEVPRLMSRRRPVA